jgi:hypothetical protein
MARFDSGVLGYMKGRIGTIVARMRYGEVYTAPRALKYNIKSEKLKFAQKVFGRRQRLNTQLRKNKKIQAFWKAIDSSGKNDNTKLMKRNFPFVTYERILPGCGFTPVSDDKIIVKNVRFVGFDVVFDFKIERADAENLAPPYDVFSILILDRYFENTNEGLIRHKILFGETVFMTIENETPDSFQTFRHLYFDSVHNRMYRAEKVYILIAAIKFNEQKNNYEWTDTYFEELQNHIPEDKKTVWNEHIYRFED